MKLPLSFSPRLVLLLVILVAVAGLLLARHFSNRVPAPTSVAGSDATETPVDPATSASSNLASEKAASEVVATLHEASTGNGGSISTEQQGTQAATASAASSQPHSQPQLVAERAETTQQVEVPTEHPAAYESDRGEQKGKKEEKERKQDQPDEAMKWRMGSLVDETGKIPEGAEVRAWLHKKQMPVDPSAWPVAALNPTDTVAGINPTSWQWLGPGNIGGRVRLSSSTLMIRKHCGWEASAAVFGKPRTAAPVGNPSLIS